MTKININTFIKPSEIHGLGLFAKSDIKKGQKITQGKIDFTYVDEWLKYLKGGLKVRSYCYNNGFCMVNHSDTPNTHRDKKGCIIASKYIKEREEITEDYNKLPDKENPFKNFDIMKMLWQSKNEI